MSSTMDLSSSQMDLSSSLVIQLTDQTILSVTTQPTLLLYYNSSYSYSPWLITVMEQLSLLCTYQKYQVVVASIDAYLYPRTVHHYTHIVPTLCLCLHGIPLVYTGLFNVGDIHIWLLAQLQTNCCPSTV